ncbi:glutathione S-transferase protein [Oesophagostomum dentatum]|uniref:glutathione transferase n=1 Tax=Oesophagostomum dentatum TaxID=61180 RepID=A0A0B1T2T3_OESDE|nr:glutathione S-transferase protein [Oesophagostomum dentatum]
MGRDVLIMLKEEGDLCRSFEILDLVLQFTLIFRMVHYKLIFFNGRGAAEIPRQLFILAGQGFEDVRLSQEEWLKRKPEMPFGQLPVLEIDGKQLAQSIAISRFLARKFGFAGSNPFEEAVVDSVVDQFRDFMVEVRQVIAVATGLQKGDMKKLVKEVFFPARDKFFGFMEKFLRKSQSGYLVGDSLTFADLYLAECSSEFAKKIPETYDGFSKVKAHADLVRSIPALQKWLEIRPQTSF